MTRTSNGISKISPLLVSILLTYMLVCQDSIAQTNPSPPATKVVVLPKDIKQELKAPTLPKVGMGKLLLRKMTQVRLAICPEKGKCEDNLVRELRIVDTVKDKKVDFVCGTDADSMLEVEWQVSLKPFGKPEAGEKYSQGRAGEIRDGIGRFSVDFAQFDRVAFAKALAALRNSKEGQGEGLVTYYLRVVPIINGKPEMTSASNAVMIKQGPRPPTINLSAITYLNIKPSPYPPGSDVVNWRNDPLVSVDWTIKEKIESKRWFRWATSAAGATHAQWQVSDRPFEDEIDTSKDAEHAGGDAGATIKTETQVTDPITKSTRLMHGWREFDLDFLELKTLLAKRAEEEPKTWTRASYFEALKRRKTLQLSKANNLRKMSDYLISRSYYIRVVPMVGDYPVGPPSNVIKVIYGPPPPQTLKYVPPPPPPVIYDLHVEFTPALPPQVPWGCSTVTKIDPSVYKVVEELRKRHFPTSTYDVYISSLGKDQCVFAPEYKRKSSAWYEYFWDFAQNTVDLVVKTWSDIKQLVVDKVADILPGCNAIPHCRDGLMAGLNAGLVAMGVPPELPSFKELTDRGMGYLIETAASEAGIPCDKACFDTIRSGVQEFQKKGIQVRLYQIQNEEIAHLHGREPLKIPPGIEVVPHPASEYRLPSVNVKVTRRPGSDISGEEIKMYRHTLRVTNQAVNNSYLEYEIGKRGTISLPLYDCCWNSVYRKWGCGHWEWNPQKPAEKILKGSLYADIEIPIPPLKPRQTIEIPIVLEHKEYWIPEHYKAIREEDKGFPLLSDWRILYKNADFTVRAVIEDDFYQLHPGYRRIEDPVDLKRIIGNSTVTIKLGDETFFQDEFRE